MSMDTSSVSENLRGNRLEREDLLKFKAFSDSLIRRALNKYNEPDYNLFGDTLADNTYLEYFNFEGLVNALCFRFYSFELCEYEYNSIDMAKFNLDRVATILNVLEFGLIKEPELVFRIDKYIYWLHTPNTLAGKSFNLLQKELRQIVINKGIVIDETDNHIERYLMKSFRSEHISNKMNFRFISNINASDTSTNYYKNDSTLILTDTSIYINSLYFKITDVEVIKLPDVQAFFKYYEYNVYKSFRIHPSLIGYKGEVIWYDIYYDVSIPQIKELDELPLQKDIVKSPVQCLIRFSEDDYGFIFEGKLYKIFK